MATQEEVDAFKELLPPDFASYGWDDTYIGTLIDAGMTENGMLLKYWEKVSASTSDYVDMSESGSSRSLSQIHKNAMALAKMYRDLLDKEENPPTDQTSGIRSKRITRV